MTRMVGKEDMLVHLLGIILSGGLVLYHFCRREIKALRSKVRALETTVAQLAKQKEALEQYAMPASGHCQIINQGMACVDGLKKRLLEAVEINTADLDIGEVIGVGSHAEVRRGRYLDTPVAVKVVKYMDEHTMERFRTEVLLMKELKHPNIANLLGVSWRTGKLMILVELFERGNLADVLGDRNCRLGWQHPKYMMMTDIVRGMAYLHQARYFDEKTNCYETCVMHRDLKPQNMLVTESLGIKIIDFGEARPIDSNNTMTQVGTLLYMAPEIVRGERYDEKCDVYSFAMVLLAMLQKRMHVYQYFVDALRERDIKKREYRQSAVNGKEKGPKAASVSSTTGDGMPDNQHYSPHMVTVAVVNNHLRPAIPADVYPSIALLMEQSWDPDAASRPSFKEIMEYMETIVHEEVMVELRQKGPELRDGYNQEWRGNQRVNVAVRGPTVEYVPTRDEMALESLARHAYLERPSLSREGSGKGLSDQGQKVLSHEELAAQILAKHNITPVAERPASKPERAGGSSRVGLGVRHPNPATGGAADHSKHQAATRSEQSATRSLLRKYGHLLPSHGKTAGLEAALGVGGRLPSMSEDEREDRVSTAASESSESRPRLPSQPKGRVGDGREKGGAG
ncbi:unnamed protein product [Chrysoparadoxa australica]